MRKYYEHNQVLEFCFRLEEGLPIIPNALINLILEGISARALELYDIALCDLVWMANHVHLIVVVRNPEDVKDFCGYIKGESSHMINRLLGRRQKSNWVKGTKSPLYLLSSEAVKKRKAYLYNNPTKADCEKTIEKYPGVTSWNAFAGIEHSKEVYKVSRDSIPTLRTPALSINEAKAMAAKLKRKEKGVRKLELKYEPNAWMDSFSELRGMKAEEVNADILGVIRENERRYENIRRNEGKDVIGATALQRQSMLREYRPKKYTPTNKVIADTPEQAHSFIQFLKWIFERGKRVYEGWGRGEMSLRMPPGLIAPRPPTLVCAWSA